MAKQNDAIEQSMKGKSIIPEGTTIYEGLWVIKKHWLLMTDKDFLALEKVKDSNQDANLVIAYCKGCEEEAKCRLYPYLENVVIINHSFNNRIDFISKKWCDKFNITRTMKFFDKNDVQQFDLYQKLYNWWSKYPNYNVFYDPFDNPTIPTELIIDFNISYLTISTKKILDEVNKKLGKNLRMKIRRISILLKIHYLILSHCLFLRISVMERVGILKSET